MTRDEQREACIKAMDTAFMSVAWRTIAPDVFERRRIRQGLAAAFDALPTAGVHVVPTEPIYLDNLPVHDLCNPPPANSRND